MLILHLTGLTRRLGILRAFFAERRTLTEPTTTTSVDRKEYRCTGKCASVYVDVENLGGSAQELITQVVEELSSDGADSAPTYLSLYVRADKLELWRIWADGKWPQLDLRVRGIQHFTSGSSSKNSADLAITADATEDFALGRTGLVAVVSNDSDFGALFVKVREMAIQRDYERTPFLWVTSERGGALSPEVKRFVPDEFRWELPSGCTEQPVQPPVEQAQSGGNNARSRPLMASSKKNLSPEEQIARTMVRHMPVGGFKSSDARKIVNQHMPDSSAPRGDAQFGKYLLDEIAPVLEDLGVEVNRDQKSTKRYAITEESKRRIRLDPD